MENKLHVTIESFSYRNGVPSTNSEHGGGFVFDARCLPNPGREERYKAQTGRDAEVQAYLERCKEVDIFLFHVIATVEFAVRQYLGRGFENLSIQFGCTGGQHRSVYCAEYLRRYLKQNFQISISLNHRNLGICEQ